MKRFRVVPIIIAAVLAIAGCRDRAAEERRAREDAEAKARADAARKEMDQAPKVFKNRDPFKKNEPATTPAENSKTVPETK